MKHLLIISILLGFVFIYQDCDQGGGTDPGKIDLNGNWTKINNASFNVIIGVLEKQPGNRILFCDQSVNGIGCAMGILRDDHTISLDDDSFPLLQIEISDNSIRISPVDGVSQTFTGTFSKSEWKDGSCGLYIKPGTVIGPLDANCIVGEWYTLQRDPFGNQSKLIYKNYNAGGTGQIIIPDDSKNISFNWYTTNDGKGDIVHESDYSDAGYQDVEYAYICTGEGLTLGSGGSWIRKNLQCLF